MKRKNSFLVNVPWRIYALLCLLGIFSYIPKVSAQDFNPIYNNVGKAPSFYPVSPKTATLFKRMPEGMDYARSRAGIRILLYEMKTASFTLPIALRYTTGGIRATDMNRTTNMNGATDGKNATDANSATDMNSTTDMNGVTDGNRATNMNGATDVNSATDVNRTTDMNSTTNMNGATDMNRATDMNGTTEVNSATDVNGATATGWKSEAKPMITCKIRGEPDEHHFPASKTEIEKNQSFSVRR